MAWISVRKQSDGPGGAAVYSLIETDKAAGVEPYYLRFLFAALRKSTSVEHFEALLPWNIDRSPVPSIERPRPQSAILAHRPQQWALTFDASTVHDKNQ